MSSWVRWKRRCQGGISHIEHEIRKTLVLGQITTRLDRPDHQLRSSSKTSFGMIELVHVLEHRLASLFRRIAIAESAAFSDDAAITNVELE